MILLLTVLGKIAYTKDVTQYQSVEGFDTADHQQNCKGVLSMANDFSTPNPYNNSTANFDAKAMVDKMFRKAKIAAGLDPDAPSYGIQRNKFMEKLGDCIVFVFDHNGLTMAKAKRILKGLRKQFEKKATQFFSKQEAKEILGTINLLQQIYKWETKYHQVWDEETEKWMGVETGLWNHIRHLENRLYDGISDWLRSYIEWPNHDDFND